MQKKIPVFNRKVLDKKFVVILRITMRKLLSERYNFLELHIEWNNTLVQAKRMLWEVGRSQRSMPEIVLRIFFLVFVGFESLLGLTLRILQWVSFILHVLHFPFNWYVLLFRRNIWFYVLLLCFPFNHGIVSHMFFCVSKYLWIHKTAIWNGWLL